MIYTTQVNDSNMQNFSDIMQEIANSHESDNGWVNGIDVCATCPNRPGGPNNKSGFCNCAIPSMYGPWRITC